MSATGDIKSAEAQLSSFFSNLSSYLSNTSGSSEPDLLELSSSLKVLDLITEASNRLNGYGGASSGILSELVDRIESIRKEIELTNMTLAGAYTQGAGEAQATGEYWSQYLIRSLNTYSGRSTN